MNQHLHTGSLSTTTLDELNSAAGLLTRVDRKYLLPLPAAQEVVDSLAGQARVLCIDADRSFAYASTYFDTPGLDSYLLMFTLLAQYLSARKCWECWIVWLVVNARRPQTRDAAGTIVSMEEIRSKMGLQVTGLVNNTHLCGDTQADDILEGAQLVREVSRLTGIPVVCHAVPRHLADEVGPQAEPVFPMDLVMKKPWETGE